MICNSTDQFDNVYFSPRFILSQSWRIHDWSIIAYRRHLETHVDSNVKYKSFIFVFYTATQHFWNEATFSSDVFLQLLTAVCTSCSNYSCMCSVSCGITANYWPCGLFNFCPLSNIRVAQRAFKFNLMGRNTVFGIEPHFKRNENIVTVLLDFLALI